VNRLLACETAPRAGRTGFRKYFVKLSLVGKEPLRLAPQLDPRALDLALRALEQDERADPVHLPLEGAICLLGRYHDLNMTYRDEPPDVRFAADAMLQSLAKWIRLLGYDCAAGDDLFGRKLIEHVVAERRCETASPATFRSCCSTAPTSTQWPASGFPSSCARQIDGAKRFLTCNTGGSVSVVVVWEAF